VDRAVEEAKASPEPKAEDLWTDISESASTGEVAGDTDKVSERVTGLDERW